MRFVLDEDVDARLVRELQQRGHVCWTVAQGGMSAEQDPDVAVYAQRKSAVLVTNDQAFGRKLGKRVSGQAVWLSCRDVKVREVFLRHFDDMLLLLERHEDLVLKVESAAMGVIHANQGWD